MKVMATNVTSATRDSRNCRPCRNIKESMMDKSHMSVIFQIAIWPLPNSQIWQGTKHVVTTMKNHLAVSIVIKGLPTATTLRNICLHTWTSLKEANSNASFQAARNHITISQVWRNIYRAHTVTCTNKSKLKLVTKLIWKKKKTRVRRIWK